MNYFLECDFNDLSNFSKTESVCAWVCEKEQLRVSVLVVGKQLTFALYASELGQPS